MSNRGPLVNMLTLPIVIFVVVLSWPIMATMASDQDAVILTQADQGKTVEIKVGQTIRVELSGNPSTGYNWNPVGVDDQYLDVLGQESKQTGQKGKLGAPAIVMIRFQTKKAGTTVIDLGYFRIWEGAATATEHYKVNLTIKP